MLVVAVVADAVGAVGVVIHQTEIVSCAGDFFCDLAEVI